MRLNFRNLSSVVNNTKISDLGDKIVSVLALTGLTIISISVYNEKPIMDETKKK